MPIWPFKRSAVDVEAERILAAVIAASRNPAFFGDGRTPDTLEGRFEMMTLNAALALHRMNAAPQARGLAQLFTDKLFRHFDSGLREAGVGDLAVPKRMHAMAGAFYGRVKAYCDAIAAGDGPALEAAVARNVLPPQAVGFASEIARYALALAAVQSRAPIAALSGPWVGR